MYYNVLYTIYGGHTNIHYAIPAFDSLINLRYTPFPSASEEVLGDAEVPQGEVLPNEACLGLLSAREGAVEPAKWLLMP